jgi:hypothetical protein
MTIGEYDAADVRYGAAFGIVRSDDLVLIRVTVFDTRTAEQKKRCSSGSRNCSAGVPASGRRTCS